jgi:hypothetical protein
VLPIVVVGEQPPEQRQATVGGNRHDIPEHPGLDRPPIQHGHEPPP